MPAALFPVMTLSPSCVTFIDQTSPSRLNQRKADKQPGAPDILSNVWATAVARPPMNRGDCSTRKVKAGRMLIVFIQLFSRMADDTPTDMRQNDLTLAPRSAG